MSGNTDHSAQRELSFYKQRYRHLGSLTRTSSLSSPKVNLWAWLIPTEAFNKRRRQWVKAEPKRLCQAWRQVWSCFCCCLALCRGTCWVWGYSSSMYPQVSYQWIQATANRKHWKNLICIHTENVKTFFFRQYSLNNMNIVEQPFPRLGGV